MRCIAGTAVAAVVLACTLGGCAAVSDLRGATPSGTRPEGGPSPVELARQALAAGNLDGAESVLTPALTPKASDKPKDGERAGPVIRGTPYTADLLVLRAELRIRQGRFPEAESDALTAMALVPATPSQAAVAPVPYGPRDGRDGSDDDNEARAPAPARPALTQRSIHIRLAELYENVGRDDEAEQHLLAAGDLCEEDTALVERHDCEFEREALVRVRIARGHYAEAEPLVLAEVADLQSRYGADDLRLAFAMCDVARFYARQGQYTLSGPLYARSFDLWKTVREDAYAEHTRALAAGEPSPLGAEFLRPRPGHFPFAAPCGLEDQGLLLYKLGKAGVAAEAIRYEQGLWAADKEAGTAAVAYLDNLVASGAEALDIASARHAVAFIARRKGDLARAEQELRLVVEAYAAAWPALARSDRRFHVQDYLAALEALIELLRSSQRFPEAVALGERARDIAAASADAYDSLRLDTLLSLAKTFREMRDPQRAEEAAGTYLDAVVHARGDTSADYAWALRTISYAYLLREELDASQRMEMQAKAIWAKQSIVAPEF